MAEPVMCPICTLPAIFHPNLEPCAMTEPSEADAAHAPFTPTGRPYVLTVRPRDEDQPPNVFGPFPTAADVRAFLDEHPAIVARGYEYSVVWPPEDAAALNLDA